MAKCNQLTPLPFKGLSVFKWSGATNYRTAVLRRFDGARWWPKQRTLGTPGGIPRNLLCFTICCCNRIYYLRLEGLVFRLSVRLNDCSLQASRCLSGGVGLWERFISGAGGRRACGEG